MIKYQSNFLTMLITGLENLIGIRIYAVAFLPYLTFLPMPVKTNSRKSIIIDRHRATETPQRIAVPVKGIVWEN